MLTAIAVDGNNQLLPIAFAFVESESTDSWYWFLERVKLAVVRDREDVCLLHDRHADILRVILDLQEGYVETGEPAKWRDVRSRWCMRHIGAKFFRTRGHIRRRPRARGRTKRARGPGQAE
jgi:hypothetical protein